MRFTAFVMVLALCGAVATATRDLDTDDPVASLNRAIQDRFTTIDKQFGLSRMVAIDDTPHRFRPETVGELDAVRELEQARLRVALYVAGRRVLDREPDLTTKAPFAIFRRVIFGPVAVTDRDLQPTLPAAVDLIDESRMAFLALQRGERHDFEMRGWTFSARAIRAGSSACLTCHQGRAVGDPLGVVLYASQPRP
jgi:hypothetical protein